MGPLHLVAAAARQRVIEAAIALASGDINDAQAFEAVLSAASTYEEARHRADAAPRRAVVPFGPRKGAPLSALEVKELQSLQRFVTGAVTDSSRQRFREANLALLEALREELQRRGRRGEAA